MLGQVYRRLRYSQRLKARRKVLMIQAAKPNRMWPATRNMALETDGGMHINCGFSPRNLN